ncbi:MAG: hypothetical protein L0Z62_28635 [Gemmataceae bacterium]|nr:hypothetical protein [Gemmataceae bacterium]
MKHMTGLAVVVVLGVVGLSQGQGKATPSNYEHLKQLEWLIGTHTDETVAKKDEPGAVKKGDKLTWTLSYKWALNKNAIQTSLTIKTKSATVWERAGMIGWDTANKQLVSGAFNSAGGHAMAIWSSKDGKWYIKGKGSNGEGKSTSSTIVLSEITKDSFVTQTIDPTVGGEKQPDSEKRTWKRVK